MPLPTLIGRLRQSPRALDAIVLVTLALLFTGAYAVVYTTGGTRLAWPYLMLVPVLLAAARFRVTGGILGGLIGGLLLGPIMPLDTTAGIPQDTANWLIRIAFYVTLGAFTGALFLLIRREGQAREQAARIDSDSGLANRTALVEALQRAAVERLTMPSLVLARVVDLGEIMEAAGVSAADELMEALASRLRSGIEAEIEVYRFSASELVVLEYLPNPSATPHDRELLQAAERPAEVHGVPVHVELALGSAGTVARDLSPREIIRRARVALFAAVERQRELCHYSEDLERRTSDTVRLLARVRRGLEQGEFELHYQPKIHTASGNPDGSEALVRWRDGHTGELISPGDFMPRVERSALITPLTRFVAESAFAFVPETGRRISINFTARNLLDPDLIASIARMAGKGAIPAGSIEIEITEGAIVRDPIAAREAIGQLRRCGFHVSLDDFGTGYSSFEYLRLLPLTGLKIDRAFVRDLEDDPRAQRLMACMIDVGHALDLEVVAEGVETAGQVRLLEQLGCDLLQGFYFARPMPGREYLDWACTAA
jgi:predicted signal transduction protein with EAL and GGDEF domain